MDLNATTKVKKKRTVNKEEWTKEKRKRLRIAGKSYINAKGEIVPDKLPGPDCKCRRKCYEKIPHAVRMKLFNGYYALKSHDEQNAYLYGLIRKVPIARKRAEGSIRRTCTFNYYIRVGGQETQVCVKALANIHGVGKSKIHILCEKLGQNILFPRDERGRHSKLPKKVSDDTVNLIKNHIYGILHSDRVRDFLKDEKANNGPDVNITQMHKDFLDMYDPTFHEELAEYGRKVAEQANGDSSLMQAGSYEISDYRFDGQMQSTVPIKVIMEDGSIAQVHTAASTAANSVEGPLATSVVVPTNESQVSITYTQKKKRKMAKDGRPEPLVRLWYYSKIFHEFYTTKEAIALRKKIMGWKTNENENHSMKPVRKNKVAVKKNVTLQVSEMPVILPLPVATESIDITEHPIGQSTLDEQLQPQVVQMNRGSRVTKATNTLPIIQQATIQPKIELQMQNVNMPIKKKPLQLQVFQTTQGGQEMYSIYPMILQDLTGLEGQTVNLQQAQIRTIGPTFQAVTAQPTNCTTNTINLAGNLQTLNINIQPGTYTTTTNGIMQYKFE